MLPFTFFPSEDVALGLFLLLTAAGWFIGGHRPARLREIFLVTVGIAFLGWCVLLISALVRPWAGSMAWTHAIVGHLMLPLVASVSGLWLGTTLSAGGRRPTFVRLLFLFLLCFCCFSNTRTGYFGPSRVDITLEPDTIRRFNILHQVVIQSTIGLLLAFWFRRLFVEAMRARPEQRSS